MTLEVMKHALDALEILNLRGGILADYEDVCTNAIAAMRQAISQPDCRWCTSVAFCSSRFSNEKMFEDCTNGDKFQALTPVRLYKVTP